MTRLVIIIHYQLLKVNALFAYYFSKKSRLNLT